MDRIVAVVSLLILTVVAVSPAAAQIDDLFNPNPNAKPGKKKSPFWDAMQVRAAVEPTEARRGQTVTFKMTLIPAPGYHTYPTTQPPGAINESATNFFHEFGNKDAVVWIGQLHEPPAERIPHGDKFQMEYRKEVTFTRSFVVRPDARPGRVEITVKADILACDDKGCLPPEEVAFTAPLTILDDAVPVDPNYAAELEAAMKGQSEPSPPRGPDAEPGGKHPVAQIEEPTDKGVRAEMPATTEELEAFYQSLLTRLVRPTSEMTTQGDGLWPFVLAGIFWGLVSLATPCVFPMIPITVTFFLKQAEKENHRPFTLALVYSGTIVLVLTIAAMLLLSALRAASVNPLTNLLLGILFIFFALSLFGLFEIELSSRWQLGFFLLFFSVLFGIIAYESRDSWLPSPWWQTVVGAIVLFDLAALGYLIFSKSHVNLAAVTSARQEQGGLAGTVFMALTFTIISFACVAPFLGAFGGTTAHHTLTIWHRLFGGLAFSVTFASPFFLLALFPSLLKKLPKSGSWMNSVKVVMGFLELAAAFKFLRQGELVLTPVPQLFTFDLVLGLWIGICLLTALYLLNFYRLPHDSPAEHLSVPRLILACAFLGLGFYLLPALFSVSEDGTRQKPAGATYAWLNSFLLPDPTEARLPWTGNLQAALERARRDRRLVFVDFTGETCTNCKINEESVFPRYDIDQALRQFELVQLYTDKVPNKYYPPQVLAALGSGVSRQRADAKVNLAFQREAFGTEQLPLYVILEPLSDGRVAVRGIYSEGKINDEAAFARFLRQPLARGNQVASR
jgi:thiol:disulfide interchange protein DsbD